jgi:hypothetical protein
MRLLRLLRITGSILGHPLASHLEVANQVQKQCAATAASRADPTRPASATDLRQRPSTTLLPLDGKEKVYGSPSVGGSQVRGDPLLW